jgi:hypothetical protein
VSENNQGLFPWTVGWQRPMLNRLLENQYSVEVFTEANLLPVLDRYSLVVVCEWQYYAPELKAALVEYVSNGGKLLLVGEQIWSQFGPALEGGKIVAESLEGLPIKRFDVGDGRVAVLEQNVSGGQVPASVVRSAVESLEPKFVVEVDGCSTVDVSVRTTQDGKLAVHLVNTSGDHESAGIIESIDPIGPLTVSIRAKARPNRVTVVPSGGVLEFQYQDGVVQLTLDQVAIHDVIVVE